MRALTYKVVSATRRFILSVTAPAPVQVQRPIPQGTGTDMETPEKGLRIEQRALSEASQSSN